MWETWLLVGCVGATCAFGSQRIVTSEVECQRIVELFSGTYDGIATYFSKCLPTANVAGKYAPTCFLELTGAESRRVAIVVNCKGTLE